MSNSNEF
ncbi:hypothetical protein PENPOL_c041G02870 [Penicillium polonicum]|nr:hypothetical protein PENPOL_c041G02870 [Penicillium polonicum]